MLKVLQACYCVPQDFIEGPMVFVWRRTRVGSPPKVGSGRLHEKEFFVSLTADRARTHMRGLFWQEANEQMRGATTTGESLGAELVNRRPGDMRQNLRNLSLNINGRGAATCFSIRTEEYSPHAIDPEPEEMQEEPLRSRYRWSSNVGSERMLNHQISQFPHSLNWLLSLEGGSVTRDSRNTGPYTEDKGFSPTFITAEAEAYYNKELHSYIL